ncbi:MAG: hydrogen peroxide-dependent heme synthase [Gemmatimonadota bacterium]
MSNVPPATLEGWYALHQVVSMDWAAHRALPGSERERVAEDARSLLSRWADPSGAGWSAPCRLVGGGGTDWMLVHFRESLDELADVQQELRRSTFGALLHTAYDYVSVTEAAMYHATAQVAQEADPGTDAFRKLVDEVTAAERETPHVRRRLYPEVPDGMRCVSFYPMTKRRTHEDNWYTLPLEERNRLMREHGLTGRRYAGRVFQVITGSVGLDDWEWGVTLFARDMLDIKGVVTEMRYDEASARYAEFGPFYTAVRLTPDAFADRLLAAAGDD